MLSRSKLAMVQTAISFLDVVLLGAHILPLLFAVKSPEFQEYSITRHGRVFVLFLCGQSSCERRSSRSNRHCLSRWCLRHWTIRKHLLASHRWYCIHVDGHWCSIPRSCKCFSMKYTRNYLVLRHTVWHCARRWFDPKFPFFGGAVLHGIFSCSSHDISRLWSYYRTIC